MHYFNVTWASVAVLVCGVPSLRTFVIEVSSRLLRNVMNVSLIDICELLSERYCTAHLIAEDIHSSPPF